MHAGLVLDVAVVGGLAGDLADVPPHAPAGQHHRRTGPHSRPLGSGPPAPAAALIANLSSLVAISPAGATSVERTYGTSVVVTVSGCRRALMQTRAASAITTMTRRAKNAARMP